MLGRKSKFSVPFMKQNVVLIIAAAALLLVGCQTTEDQFTQSQTLLNRTIAGEPPGNYFVGRRFYRKNFFFWGYIRQPAPALEQRQAGHDERAEDAGA